MPSVQTFPFGSDGQAAKYTFGDWAAKGLSLSATWADNVSNYLSTKCYKVMLCDPKERAVELFRFCLEGFKSPWFQTVDVSPTKWGMKPLTR